MIPQKSLSPQILNHSLRLLLCFVFRKKVQYYPETFFHESWTLYTGFFGQTVFCEPELDHGPNKSPIDTWRPTWVGMDVSCIHTVAQGMKTFAHCTSASAGLLSHLPWIWSDHFGLSLLCPRALTALRRHFWSYDSDRACHLPWLYMQHVGDITAAFRHGLGFSCGRRRAVR